MDELEKKPGSEFSEKENQANNHEQQEQSVEESSADKILRKVAEKKAQKAAENQVDLEKTEDPEKTNTESKETDNSELKSESVTQEESATVQSLETQPEPESKSEPKEEDKQHSVSDAGKEEVLSESEDSQDEDDEENLDLDNEEEIDDETNYQEMSKSELVVAINTLIRDTESVADAKDEIEKIRSIFYRKHKNDLTEAEEKFEAAGGNREDFEPAVDPDEEAFKVLYGRYKQARFEHGKQMEKQRHENLKIKYAIIDELKDLSQRQESLNDTFEAFRGIQKRWKEAGQVPQPEVKKLWETYHHHVENFYDYIKINKELRDLDLRKNLEEKIKLCEKAEELMLEEKVVKAFRDLQILHLQWREIGPVPRENKEEIWERFKAATTAINKKHQDYFENLKNEQQNNLKAKVMICEKAEEYAQMNLETPKEWEKISKEMIDLQNLWRAIGFAPKKDNNKVYTRFRSACDTFFNTKREFYNKIKEEHNQNLERKLELCNLAETLKESTDWRKTTDELIALQKQWKGIGPVPRKMSDQVWRRFRAACNRFFERKEAHYKDIEAEQKNNLVNKQELIAKLENMDPEMPEQDKFNQLKEIQNAWSLIGFVPIKQKDIVQKQFRKLINDKFDALKLDNLKKGQMSFKNRIDEIKQMPRGNDRLRNERERLIFKIQKIESDLILWENNIGFFSNSKNAEAMIQGVRKKIEEAKEQVKNLKTQLRVIDKSQEEN